MGTGGGVGVKIEGSVEHKLQFENFSHANTSNYVLFQNNRRPQM